MAGEISPLAISPSVLTGLKHLHLIVGEGQTMQKIDDRVVTLKAQIDNRSGR